MLKIAVKVNIGKHDIYRKDEYKNSGWDFITFTDLNEDEYRKWSGDNQSEVISIDKVFFPPIENICNKKKSSYLGIESLKVLDDVCGVDYDMSIWLSGDTCLIGDLDDFVNRAHKKSVSAPIHTDCRNALDDASKILSYKKDMEANIVDSLKAMRDAGLYLNGNGYHETCGLIRSRNEYSELLSDLWAQAYLAMPTVRDQLVLPYARWAASFFGDSEFHGYDKTLMNGTFK